jgi:catecholate siderophore receptor
MNTRPTKTVPNPRSRTARIGRGSRSLRDAAGNAPASRAAVVPMLAVALALEPAAAAERADAGVEVIVVKGRGIDSNPNAQRGVRYKARRSGDHRRVADLADTPQTITVLTRAQLQDAGTSDLRDILAAQPGITLGTGENGNAFGDRYVIRGHEARSDVFVDGLRDPGMTTRESFATEQIEITKGPSSTFAGRGSTGGAVNGITKQARTSDDFAEVTAGGGSDRYRRIGVDANKRIDDTVAVRANVMHAYREVPDRAPANAQRDGVLLSASYEPSSSLRLLGDVYALRADDVPDLGGYFDQARRKPVDAVPVYTQDGDFLRSKVRTGTLRFQYTFGNGVSLHNGVRYGRTRNGYVVTGARGATRAADDPVAPSAPTITLSGHQGWQEVDYLGEQFTIGHEVTLGGSEHALLYGVELTDEKVLNGVYALASTGATNCLLPGQGTARSRPGHCALDGAGNAVPGLGGLLGRTATRGPYDSDYRIRTLSAYVMDTVSIGERWQVFAGVRVDDFDYTNDLRSGAGVVTEYAYDDHFWNGHAGIVHHLTDSANVYVAWSTSTNINGGESDLGGNCGYGGLCGTPEQVRDSAPEQTQGLELGTKVELFDDRLLLAAAAFQTTKDEVMESVGNAYSSLGTLNTGRNRIQGVELSATGNITPSISTQFGATFMSSKVLRSFDVASEGRVLSNVADDSVYLQLRWQATRAFHVGGTVTYSSEMYAGQPDTAAGFNAAIGDYSIVVPDYVTLDVFAGYDFSPDLKARLQVVNVTDATYYTAAYRSGSFMYRGDARNVRLTFTYDL